MRNRQGNPLGNEPAVVIADVHVKIGKPVLKRVIEFFC